MANTVQIHKRYDTGRHEAENSIFGDFRQSDNVPFTAQRLRG
jgi:hypothetical protein